MDQAFTINSTGSEDTDLTREAGAQPASTSSDLPWVNVRIGVDPTAIILSDATGAVVGRLQITNAKDRSDRRLTAILCDVLARCGTER